MVALRGGGERARSGTYVSQLGLFFFSASESLLDSADDDKLFLRYLLTTGFCGLGDLELKERTKKERREARKKEGR